MATIDLGKIKQVFRGTYNNATAYTVDDLVSFTDTVGGLQNTSTYIAVANTTGNAPASGGTIHASWNLVAQGVPDRLPSQSGNAGKFLTTDGSSVSFGAVTQAVKKIYSKRDGDRHSVNNQVQDNNYGNMWNWTNMQQVITPQSATSQFHVVGSLNINHYGSYEGHVTITYQHSGLAGETAVVSNSQTNIRRTHRANQAYDNASTMMGPVPLDLIIAPATTNAVTFRIKLSTTDSSYPWHVNRDASNTTNTSDGGAVLSSWTITELDGSQVTLASNGIVLDT